ncbi:putative alcohol dehydrogenase [Tothia fuscella]|uniref:Alcohol dehydrogenase n=1 Tax=Tothia fuscella TaxID=1048955 RepID=A0A9P4U366_9PEZI|nr:putative alcohol dehydrogenase [Tothia fuscella]
MGRLQGKVALITGAGSGFGEGMAKAFTKEGANVIIADIAIEGGKRVESEIEAAKSEGHGSAMFLEFDVTKKQAWEKGLELAKEKFGKLDIVCNNAGTTYRKKPSIDVTEDEFDKIIAVNIKSIYQSVVVVMPYFVEQKYGVYLNTSSVAGTRVRPGQVFYGGTKGFLNTITQGLAAEYGPEGVRVNSICPLRGATGLLEMFSGVPDTPEERARFAQSVPLGRMSTPDDISAAAIYLASDEAAFVSGVNLPVDGGRLAV